MSAETPRSRSRAPAATERFVTPGAQRPSKPHVPASTRRLHAARFVCAPATTSVPSPYFTSSPATSSGAANVAHVPAGTLIQPDASRSACPSRRASCVKTRRSTCTSARSFVSAAGASKTAARPFCQGPTAPVAGFRHPSGSDHAPAPPRQHSAPDASKNEPPTTLPTSARPSRSRTSAPASRWSVPVPATRSCHPDASEGILTTAPARTTSAVTASGVSSRSSVTPRATSTCPASAVRRRATTRPAPEKSIRPASTSRTSASSVRQPPAATSTRVVPTRPTAVPSTAARPAAYSANGAGDAPARRPHAYARFPQMRSAAS